MATERELVLNKSADKLKGCAALPRTLSPARCARGRRDKLTPPKCRECKKARVDAETPAEPLGVFRAFSPAPLYMLYFLPCHLGDKPAFICFLCPLSRKFTCGTFIFQVSLLRQFSNSLQKNVSKNLRISLLLTTGNDFFPFLNGKIFRCFLYSFGFPVFLCRHIIPHLFQSRPYLYRYFSVTKSVQNRYYGALFLSSVLPPPQIAFSGGYGSIVPRKSQRPQNLRRFYF